MEHAGSRSPRILFVDDEVRVLNSLRRGLHRLKRDWSVDFADHPQQAIQQARESAPDLVVTDLDMPELTGIEMIIKMRASLPVAPVFILLTGAGDLSSAIAAINKASIFRFLTKPCPIDELSRAIDDGLALRQTNAANPASTALGVADAALERLSTAVVVVDRSCKVVYLNESATTILNEQSGARIDRGGSLRAHSMERTQELHRMVAEVELESRDAINFLSLPAGDDERDLHVVIEAMSEGHVALYLGDPSRVAITPSLGLQKLFGLTKAEATVAHALASGASLEDASVASGITVASARTYLKRIFSKTGVSRQGELIQLLLSTPMPLSRQSQISIPKS